MKMSDSAMLEYVGGEVIVSGLKARPDLNGRTARVDEWLEDRGRFRCVVYDKDWLEGESVNLRPECCDRPTCERTGEELPCGRPSRICCRRCGKRRFCSKECMRSHRDWCDANDEERRARAERHHANPHDARNDPNNAAHIETLCQRVVDILQNETGGVFRDKFLEVRNKGQRGERFLVQIVEEGAIGAGDARLTLFSLEQVDTLAQSSQGWANPRDVVRNYDPKTQFAVMYGHDDADFCPLRTITFNTYISVFMEQVGWLM